MAGDVVYVTKEHFEAMQVEIAELKGPGRKRIADAIAEARSHGDLSENADYDAAKHAQELHEIRLSKLESAVSRAQVIDPSDFPDDKIYILTKVKLLNKKTKKKIEYLLVGSEEADYEKNKLSVDSPLGKAMMGKKVGELVQTKVPAGVIEYEVLSISK